MSVCVECLRRGWLLARRGVALDRRCRDAEQLEDALALTDEALAQALGGRRRAELTLALAQFDRSQVTVGAGVQVVCRHHRRFPRMLSSASAPRAMYVRGGATRLRDLLAAPAVAIVGARDASDYGLAVASALARGLAASGVTVLSGARTGVCRAALEAALACDGRAVAILDGGLDASFPAALAPLARRLVEHGCLVSELPSDAQARRWSRLAAERVIAQAAAVTVVVEARQRPNDRAPAVFARAAKRTLAAVPGRVTSPLSSGPLALLREGAELVSDARDVLDLLCLQGPIDTRDETAERTLAPRLRGVLERVCAGCDTAEELCRQTPDPGTMLHVLSELELTGWLGRGDGGRYVPRLPSAF